MKRMVGARPARDDLITRIFLGGPHKTEGKCNDHRGHLFQSHLFFKFVFITEMETSSYVQQLKYPANCIPERSGKELAQQADVVCLKALGRHPRSVALHSHSLGKAAFSVWAIADFL